MKNLIATLVTSLACCTLGTGLGIAQPTVINPSSGTIGPNGIGVTQNTLYFSQPYCTGAAGQTRGVYSATNLTAGSPAWTATMGLVDLITDHACAENYFFVSPGLGGFPTGSIYTTNPNGVSMEDEVRKDGGIFIPSVPDSAPGHAGITFDTVGTFNFDLIVTTPSGITFYDSNGAIQPAMTVAAPANVFLETATVAPLKLAVGCSGCLYVTSTNPGGNGKIYTVSPGTNTLTLAATTPGTEPEGILFVPPVACKLTGTNFTYFVSAYASGGQIDNNNSTSGSLLAYTDAQTTALAGQALVPLESGSIYTYDGVSTFALFDTPKVPVTGEGYQLEGASMTACPLPVTNPNGRMTGGGSFFTPGGMRVTHGLELHCTVPSHPNNNNLEINWGGGNNFHLDQLTGVTCTLDPAINQGHPSADFNTMIGTGTGTLNGAPATINFEFTDAGEPGTSDKAGITIVSGTTTFTVPLTVLDNGNQQAHKN